MKKGLKWIIAFAGAIAIVLLLRDFAFTSCLIPSSGMENSLFQGERILVNKWSYGLRVPYMSLFSYHRWKPSRIHKNDIVVFNNPAAIKEPIIDRRGIYISRCIGVPGDTLLIDSLFNVVDCSVQFGPDRKQLYTYPQAKEQQVDSLLSILSISSNELMGQHEEKNVRSFSRYEYYLIEQAMNGESWIQPLIKKQQEKAKQLIIPGKGKAIQVFPWNKTLLLNTLVLHEGKQAEIRNDTLYIEGRPSKYCYFTKDYYWMASNNSINLSDSRLFGFVPQDHIIGKASRIWFSKKDHTGIFSGYRWDRFFRQVK